MEIDRADDVLGGSRRLKEALKRCRRPLNAEHRVVVLLLA